ncbi:hypothetical protein [Spirosoma rhododendri]|uniref:Right handed beta helix domain-containing protein n=1 Tax=Spirosoma rhododendri TaxID=2728024 RepID=A0A7L5DKY2_9BACT|nr:hypothetical protein [Spirosoma rhododendri]QJD79144.1 hypothetical protein HH216_12480 [Spirosoma rhododendri]
MHWSDLLPIPPGAFPLGKPIVGRTKADIQAAIDASNTPGERFVLVGEYDFSASPAEPLIIRKNVELIGTNGATFNGKTTSGALVKIHSINSGLTLRNISFISQAPTSPTALVYCNEEGDINNLTFDSCTFVGNKNGNYNALGMNAWSEQAGKGVRFKNITFLNCRASAGRMGYELLSHKNDGDARITNLRFIDCRAEHCGTAIADRANTHGMGISISGDITDVTITDPVCIDTLLGIELVGTRRFTVQNPRISSQRIAKTTDNQLIYPTGISLSDGGNRGHSTQNGRIVGGAISVAGRVMNAFYADTIAVTGGNHIGGLHMQLQHGTGFQFHNVNLECTGSHYVAEFEDEQNVLIEGGNWSRQRATAAPRYQPVSFDGSCSGTVRNLHIQTNKAIKNGQSDNYFGNEPITKNYLYSASPNVRWSNVFWNGTRQRDHL